MGTVEFSEVSDLAPATSVQPEQLARHQGFQQRWFLPGSLTEHYRHQLSSTQRKCCPGMELFQVDLFNITVLLGGSDEFET